MSNIKGNENNLNESKTFCSEQYDVEVRNSNNDTVEAIEEVKSMKKSKNYGKTYTDVDDMIKELLD